MTEETSSSLVRGIETLVGLAEAGGPTSFSVLAASLKMPPSTVHRILQALRKAGYVTQDPATGSYSPGMAFLQAATLFCSQSTLPRAIESTLTTLMDDSGESAFFALYLPQSQRMRFIAQLYSEHAVHYVLRKDKDYSLLWGASGRSIAAHLPAPMLQALHERASEDAEGNSQLPVWREFQSQMNDIRSTGYCTTYNQRFEGAHSVASAVLGSQGGVLGCIGICMPSMRRDPAKIEVLGALVSGAAEHLSTVARCVIEQPSLGAASQAVAKTS